MFCISLKLQSMETPETGPDIFTGPPRPEPRIDELLALMAADWKRSGSDQRFFQYIENLPYRLGVQSDAYFLEDEALIDMLRSQAPSD